MLFDVRKQMLRLLAVSAVGSFSLGGSAWVVLLAARGFSLLEIGVAEGVFHIASLVMEVPSGALADVLGRKRAMILSNAMGIVSSLLMIVSRDLAGVCLALVFAAWSYNFASGAREALAYDSLKSCGQEEHYLRYSSLEMTVYRVSSASAILLTGLTLLLGYKIANLIDALFAAACIVILLPVREPEREARGGEVDILHATLGCFVQSLRFLRRERYARRLMLTNAFLGALAILLSFFLQPRLQASSLPPALLGPALFAMGLGGAVGARLALRIEKWRMRSVMAVGAAGIAAGLLLGVSQHAWFMILGGFLAAALDDMIQVRADARLNDLFPSEQRATILSVASLLFSLIMIVLSPLAGWFFGSI